MSCNDADIVYGKNISERLKHVAMLAACFFWCGNGNEKRHYLPVLQEKNRNVRWKIDGKSHYLELQKLLGTGFV